MGRGAFDTGVGASILGGFQVGLQGLGFQLRQQQFLENQRKAEAERAELAASERSLLAEFDRFNPAPFAQQFPTTPEGQPAQGPPIEFQDFGNTAFADNRQRFSDLPQDFQEREIRTERDFALETKLTDQIIQQSEDRLLRDVSAIRNSEAPEADKDRAIRAKVDAHKDLSERTRISILGEQAFAQPTAAEDLTPEQVQQQALAAGLSQDEANRLALQVSLGGNLTQSSISAVRRDTLRGEEAFVEIAKSKYTAALSELQSAERAREIIANEGLATGDVKAAAQMRVVVARADADAAFNDFNQRQLGLAESLSRPVESGFLGQFENDPALEPPTDLSQTTLPSGGEPELGPPLPQPSAVASPPIPGDAVVTPEGSMPGVAPPSQVQVMPPGTAPALEGQGLIVLKGVQGLIGVSLEQIDQGILQAKIEFFQTHGRAPLKADIRERAAEIAYESALAAGGF